MLSIIKKKKKTTSVVQLISNRADCSTVKVIMDKENHYTVKGSVLQENKTILTVYKPNNKVSKYMK